MEREHLGSRLGFILLSAGCAIGIGNVWKFPYMVGSNGGGAFVLLYLIFLFILGIPVMTMEFAVGRGAKQNPVLSFKKLEKKGHKWHIHGYVCIIGSYLLMSFYTSVAGWMLYYFYASLTGKYEGLDSAGVGNFFNNMLLSPQINITGVIIICILGFLVLSFGLQKGLESITKVIMLLLLFLMGILAVHSVLLKGGLEGIVFYLKPDINVIKEVGFSNVAVGAMQQAFFTLSLGIGSMAIFGSYIDKKRALMGEAVSVAILDTVVAVCSGLIIFPACSAFGVSVDSGPSLLFITLPNVFNNLEGGRIWGTLFFLFMNFASFSTILAVFENIVSGCMELFNISRKKACLINIFVMIILSMPCAIGFNLLSFIQPLGDGTTILDLEDYIVSQWLLPLGSLVFVLFCTYKFGWGWENFLNEANEGKGLKVRSWMKLYMQIVLPIVLISIFILGII